MDTIQMTEKDAERWETIVRLHSDDYADADDFWLEGIDELCSAFQPNKCDGCPVKSFTGRAHCGGNRHWRLWAYAIDAYLALKEGVSGFECVSCARTGICHLGAKPDFVVAFRAAMLYH